MFIAITLTLTGIITITFIIRAALDAGEGGRALQYGEKACDNVACKRFGVHGTYWRATSQTEKR